MQRKVIMSFAFLPPPPSPTLLYYAISTICCSDCASSTAYRVMGWQPSPLLGIVSVNKHVFFINPLTLDPLFSVSVFLPSFPVTLNPLKVESFEGKLPVEGGRLLISWWLRSTGITTLAHDGLAVPAHQGAWWHRRGIWKERGHKCQLRRLAALWHLLAPTVSPFKTGECNLKSHWSVLN